ncbi:TIGR03364 family FAD-dependent oxidoreductase [Marmoricola endophyticus]|nr:TIGR03364 family FAD-dependent oxidoreductase [Marmoricola endophyticus]
MSSTSPRADTAVDLVVVGAGIVGLAHAAEALDRGLRVVVLERDEHAVGASVRNFGHVCTTAQGGRALDLALVARQTWLDLGRKAGFEVTEAGTLVLARAEDEVAVLEELAAERGAEQVRLLDPAAAAERSGVDVPDLQRAAHLPLDLRVDPREAVPALARWLSEAGVGIRFGTHVGEIVPSGDEVLVRTGRGEVRARHVVHAVGHDVDRLFPSLAEEYAVRRCRLQMLEVAPPGDVRIAPALLTGLSMARYAGLAAMPSADAVAARFAADAPELLALDVNLMLTQRPDGSIVLGDTHHRAVTHDAFDEETDAALLLREGARLLGAPLTVRRRWRGVYASSSRTDFLVAAPHPLVRVVSVTSGIGMTTSFGLAPTVLDQLL